MNERQQRFVFEYVKDGNATQAAIRAGYSENGAGQIAHKLLNVAEIQAAIEERRAEVSIAAKLDAAWVLRQWAEIATADPNELMQVRRTCCRRCHGLGHHYQWTENEYLAAVDAAIAADTAPPDYRGGFGYVATRAPHSACPECHGEGVEDVRITDTRKLKGGARRLYAGAERTRNGIKVRVRDQDAALANIAKYLGMNIERKEISGIGGAPLTVASLKAEDLTDDQLAALIHGNEG